MTWGLSAGQKESVLVVGAQVAKGQTITRSDLTEESVAGVAGAIPAGQISTVVGKTAAVDLVGGQVLTAPMFTSVLVPGPGHALIGLALDPTRLPGAGLDPGDVVDVIAVPDADTAKADPTALDEPTVLAKSAQVYSVNGVSTAGGDVVVTLIVKAADANRVTAYSTQNRTAIVETAAGAGGAASTSGSSSSPSTTPPSTSVPGSETSPNSQPGNQSDGQSNGQG